MTISEAMTPRRYSWLSALIIVMTVVTLATGAIALHYVETRMVTAFGKSLALTAAEVSDKLDRFLFERYGDVMMMAGTFSAQLARRHELALVVHTREAWDDTIDLLGTHGLPDRTIIHCFTGGPDEARRCLDLGASLSFSGVVTFKNAEDVRQAALLCPLDRLLVETDSPFLTPVPHRGTLNEPSRVPLVGATIAQVKGLVTADVALVTTANARRAFAC